MTIDGAAFAIIGALEAFPRRLAAREIKARGGELAPRHLAADEIRRLRPSPDGRADERTRIAGAIERGPEGRRRRRSAKTPFSASLVLPRRRRAPRDLSTRQLVDQSRLDAETFERLRLFDAFESAEEPFGFRDLVAARQYARLAAEGVDWLGLVRARARNGSPA